MTLMTLYGETQKLIGIPTMAHQTAARHRSLRWDHGTTRPSKHASGPRPKVRPQGTLARAPRAPMPHVHAPNG